MTRARWYARPEGDGITLRKAPQLASWNKATDPDQVRLREYLDDTVELLAPATMINAARALAREGVTPTVEGSAARAGVSRATAYRYFTNQRELLAATYPMTEMASLLPPDAPADPVERVLIVARGIIDLTISAEAELRISLRLSLESGTGDERPLRKGRRRAWFTDAVQPLHDRLTPAALGQLSLALAASIGIETWVWLTDIIGLTPEQATKQLLWTARTLLEGATANH